RKRKHRDIFILEVTKFRRQSAAGIASVSERQRRHISSGVLPLAWSEITDEPAARQIGDAFERTGLLEQVCGAGDDFKPFLAPKCPKSLLVEIDDGVILAS